MTFIDHRRTILSASCLFFLAGFAFPILAETPQAPPKGLRVLTAGHSFHAWMPGYLSDMAAKAQISGHQQVSPMSSFKLALAQMTNHNHQSEFPLFLRSPS